MKRAIFDAKTRLLMRNDRRAFEVMVRNERLGGAAFEELSRGAATRIALQAFDSSPYYREL